MWHRFAYGIEQIQEERERASRQASYKGPHRAASNDILDDPFERSESQYQRHKSSTSDHQEHDRKRTKQHRQNGPNCLDTTDLQPKAREPIDIYSVLDLRDASSSERTERPNVERDSVARICGTYVQRGLGDIAQLGFHDVVSPRLEARRYRCSFIGGIDTVIDPPRSFVILP